MAITLPNQAEANVASNAAITATITAAQNAFIASTTVLINQAIANGFFQVQPYVTPILDPSFVITYFQALGYTVLFPLCYGGPYNPCFVAGFPEALPPGYVTWNCCCQGCGPRRISISWGPPTESFVLLTDGSLLELTSSPGGLFLE